MKTTTTVPCEPCPVCQAPGMYQRRSWRGVVCTSCESLIVDATKYRLVVGVRGDPTGRMLPCKATTPKGAYSALKRALAPYGRDGWGRVDERNDMDGSWDATAISDGYEYYDYLDEILPEFATK